MTKERTFVMIKPDAVQRGFVGEIISRFEKKGVKVVAMKMVSVSKELAEKHYGIHKGKSFFEPTVQYITSSPVIALVLEGENAIEMVRGMMGKTNPQGAAMGTEIMVSLSVETLYMALMGQILQSLKLIYGLNPKRYLAIQELMKNG
jgi:nucleoside-diphosphate kinase